MFDLRMQHEVVDLIRDGDRIDGVVARGPDGLLEDFHADLVVGCDGRHSATGSAAQLELEEFGVPIDVLWFRLSRPPDDPEQVLGNRELRQGADPNQSRGLFSGRNDHP